MWLWTLSAGRDAAERPETTDDGAEDDPGDEVEDVEEATAKSSKAGGFGLEFDAARKIAQGLGRTSKTLLQSLRPKDSRHA